MQPAVQQSHRLLEYDAFRRRLWIFGQRCHHGATGAMLAAIACAGLIVETSDAVHHGRRAHSAVALAAGGALMIHDWKDHSIWFERGHGTQP